MRVARIARFRWRWLLLIAVLPLSVILLAPVPFALGQTQSAPDTDACAAVRYLMAEGITPYDLPIGGGVFQPGEMHTSTLTPETYADVWSFNVERPASNAGIVLNAFFNFTVRSVDPALNLEFALFRGMEVITDDASIADYQPLAADTTYTYTLNRSAFYTLIIRRAQLRAPEATATGAYAFTANFNGGGAVDVLNLRDESTGSPLLQSPQLLGGVEVIDLPGAALRVHPGAPTSVGGYRGSASQVLYSTPNGNFNLYLNAWADDIGLLGGDLSVTGVAEGSQPRIVYLKDYGYEVGPQDGDLLNFVDSNGVALRLSWDILSGVWVDDACAGIKLKDGRTFTGTIAPDDRSVTFRGPEESFTIALTAPGPEATIPFTITLDWAGIAPASEMQLRAGTLQTDLLEDRRLLLQSTRIDMRRVPGEDGAITATTSLAVTLNDEGASLLLDWTNFNTFAYQDGELRFTFYDAPRESVARSGLDLLRVEAIDDVIQIVYKDQPDGSPGEQRLLLPGSESYIELITPAGLPAFDGLALAGGANYAPRALNNTGGECYPVNTLLEQANCPPNGSINPANGNLWYAVTDQFAPGGLIDLTLTRSHNSALVGMDGPFGPGWSSEFRLDYAVPFDAETGTRPITPDAVAAYPVGLDLSWAPRGYVTLITPSGSQHVFVTESNRFNGGTLTALTMPGWTLNRDDVRDVWTLQQPDGLAYTYDRAGRLINYGYPLQDRIITVHYPRDQRDGPGAIGSDTPVIITGAADQRQLELYYNAEHHIIRSILRDLTTSAPDAACEPDDGCFETRYTYNERGLLTDVQYAGGQTASYTYDFAGRLNGHEDPRAPVAREMAYTYSNDGAARAATIIDDGAETTWQTLSVTIEMDAMADEEEPVTRVATLTGFYGSTRTYTYQLDPGTLKAAGAGFTLTEETSPLADVNTFEAVPIRYEWDNGLLTRVLDRQLFNNTGGRNSFGYNYGPGAQISGIRSGFPSVFSATFAAAGAPQPVAHPTLLTFADGARQTLTYDDNGRLETLTDRDGGVYRYTWNEDGRLASLTRESDGTVTDYAYGELGLVTAVTQRLVTDDPLSAYTLTYTYDGLGRLIRLDDPLTGSYTLSYTYPAGEADAYAAIRLTDATGAATTTRFDARGQLFETTITGIDGALLRRTTYTYDTLGRLTGESRHLLPLSDAETDDEDAEPELFVTSYAYEAAPVLDALPGSDGATSDRFINGYRVTAGVEGTAIVYRYTYDALGRIREVQDPLGRITRYDYSVEDTGALANGLRITQRDVQAGQVVRITSYVFDLRWQLRGVSSGDLNWSLIPRSGNEAQYWLMQAETAGILEQTWDTYSQGRPAGVRITQSELQLSSQTTLPRPALGVEYDFAGRPVQVTDGSGLVYRVLYCPLSGGGERVIQLLPAAANNEEAPGCDATAFQQAVTYDAAGRLVRVEDTYGTRAYTYVIEEGGWRVDVIFGGPDSGLNWLLRYDSAGDLVEWRDESGITRTYTYDILGRLRRVLVEGQPEASFTFTYNITGLLTSSMDDLGRGVRYAYDDLGRRRVVQDARTGSTAIYGYNVAGLLSTVISPQGNTTAYLYDDLGRLTGVVDPTGNPVEFDWDDLDNRLTYTDPRGSITDYFFGGMGALWRVVDPPAEPTSTARRAHELLYDPAGRLIQWVEAVGSLASRRLTITPDTPFGFTVSGTGVDWARSFQFAPDGQLLATGAETGGALSLDYDPTGRLAALTAGDRVWTLSYNDGPAVTLRDADGDTRALGYDALNRLVSVERSDSGGYTLEYGSERIGDVRLSSGGRVYTFSPGDASGIAPSVVLRAPGQRVTYTYDAEGLLVEITREVCVSSIESGAIDPIRLDDCIQQMSDEVWRTGERFVYNALGQPIRYIDPEDNIATFSYDEVGNLINYQNVRGQTFTYRYDSLNRLTALTGPTGIRLLLNYNVLDEVIGICQSRADGPADYAGCAAAGGELETYTYDSLGLLTAQIVPGSDGDSAVDFAYDESGLLATWSVAGGAGVGLDYTDDGLGWLEQIITTSSRYELNYDGSGRLASVDGQGTLAYTYDPAGRLASFSTGVNTFVYDYANLDLGYTVRHAESGAALIFSLDEQGLLTGIDYVTGDDAADSPEVSLSYRSSSDRTLLVQLRWPDGDLVEFQLDQRGRARNIAYIQDNLFIDYSGDIFGQVRQEAVTGAAVFFETGVNGYIIQAVFENDRPLSMRLSERATGDLLYLQTFTYNGQGRRATETREYGDGTRVTIRYQYANQNQLIRRTITISRQEGFVESSGALLILLLGAAMWLTRSHRRRLLAITFASGLLATLTLSLTGAQQSADETYSYRYDNAGNMVEISLNAGDETIQCAAFAYDSANRLTRVTREDLSRTYAYDVYNRLIRIDDMRLVYNGGSDTLLAAIDVDGNTTFYGQTGTLPGLFQATPDETLRLFTNGRDNVLATRDADGLSGAMWLRDPLGRYLSLTPPTSDEDVRGCGAAELPQALTSLAPPQILSDGMIWDAAANLYFLDGRAYTPGAGVFLQRDHLGPDAFGNVYAYPFRLEEPPVRDAMPQYTAGLIRLRDALGAIDAARPITAEDVRAQYLPGPHTPLVEPLYVQLDATAAVTRRELADQLQLPDWLAANYNLPAPYVDATGRLRQPDTAAPGQGGLRGENTLPDILDVLEPDSPWLPTIGSPLARLGSRVALSQPVTRPYVTYVPDQWLPDTPGLNDLWANVAPSTGLPITPAAVLDWLPRPLDAPQDAAAALDAVQTLIALPNRTGDFWLQAALAIALPGLPDLPPANFETWLAQWFTGDTLGVAESLSARWPEPPAPDVPIYDLGPYADWLLLDAP